VVDLVATIEEPSLVTDRPARSESLRTGDPLAPWLADQVVNLSRHAAALRPFRAGEFGASPPGPSDGHREATNRLIRQLRQRLLKQSRQLRRSVKRVLDTDAQGISGLLRLKTQALANVKHTEKIWQFYFDVFSQRATQIGPWLLGCDRIALDCYQAVWLGLGRARTVPAPGPFTVMKTGRSPATYRRGIPLRRLGRQLNPFPLVELPYHRLVNPWTLGAIPHELAHNLQNDLNLQRAIPETVFERLRSAGVSARVAAIWRRWNREAFADLMGLLLGGPQVVASLLDVIGRASNQVLRFNPRGVHPTPYVRAFLSFELLRRMGFPEQARGFRDMWKKMYPDPRRHNLPSGLIRSLPRATQLVVDAMCFQSFTGLGNRSLSQVVNFGRKEQHMTYEAAERLASGTNPGIVPERFLIGAARIALDQRMARPGVIMKNFYRELGRR